MLPYSNFLRGHASRRTGPGPGGRPRVLIVEDEALIAVDLERRLNRMGFEPVGVADNRDDAVDLFRKIHPDLVLMDICIRGPADGIETAREMLDFSDAAVVFLTAYADDATVARAAELSPYGYLAKPFDDRTLSATCKVATTRHAMDRDLRVLAHVALQASIGLVVMEVVGDERPIIFANDAFARMSGRSVGDLLSSRCCLPTDGPGQEGVARLSMAIDGLTEAQETILVRHEGEERSWAFASVSPVAGPSGRVTHVVALFADVTHERAAQDALAEMQRAELVGRFSAAICHDFNNFLSVVLSYAGLVQQAVTDADVLQDVEEILRAAEKGVALTSQLVGFARHDERTVGASADLAQALRDARGTLKAMAGSRCTLRLQLPSDPAWVDLSPGSIEQIFLNLVANARDAMPDGGRISILAGLPAVPSRTLPAGAYVRVEVRDTGSGVDPAIAERIFEPFFTTKPRSLGSGIGLARCRMLVERAGGSIQLRSSPGAGTTVIIDLPTLDVPATRSAADAPTEALGNAHGATCVLVMPDESLRRAYASSLSRVGFAVSEASSGREAHEALDVLGTRLDLLVCAASLPPGPTGTGADVVAHARTTAPASRAILAADILDARDASWAGRATVLWMPLSGATLARHALDLLEARAGALEPAIAGIPAGESGDGAASVMQAVAAASAAGRPAAEEAGASHAEAATGADFDESLRRLYVLFQPIVQADNGTPYGYEALMRSRGPCRSAADLLDAAERLGRVEELGRAVRRLVAHAIEDNAGIRDTIFVNIHPRELSTDVLMRDDEPLLPFADRVVWEVIERERIASPGELCSTLRALRTAGYRLAIDDLGEGYASLSWLVALVPDVAKIDLSLVRDIDRSRIKRDLVGAIVSVCRRIGTIVVAEGVESVEEAAVLRDLGCDLLQGHLFARPSPPFSEPE